MKRTLGGLAIVVALTVTGAANASSGIAWEKYMRSGAVVAAIAAAVAQVDHCSKPISIEETAVGGKVRLSFTCNGGEDEEGTAVIEFDDYGDGALVPSRFELAG